LVQARQGRDAIRSGMATASVVVIAVRREAPVGAGRGSAWQGLVSLVAAGQCRVRLGPVGLGKARTLFAAAAVLATGPLYGAKSTIGRC
jgi:hypothetical protein